MKTISSHLNPNAGHAITFASATTLQRNLILPLLCLFLMASRIDAATVQVQVAPNGSLIFSPASVSIQPGDTVEWIWKSSGHSTTSGTPGTPNGLWDSGVQNGGFTFFHSFPTSVSSPFSY